MSLWFARFAAVFVCSCSSSFLLSCLCSCSSCCCHLRPSFFGKVVSDTTKYTQPRTQELTRTQHTKKEPQSVFVVVVVVVVFVMMRSGVADGRGERGARGEKGARGGGGRLHFHDLSPQPHSPRTSLSSITATLSILAASIVLLGCIHSVHSEMCMKSDHAVMTLAAQMGSSSSSASSSVKTVDVDYLKQRLAAKDPKFAVMTCASQTSFLPLVPKRSRVPSTIHVRLGEREREEEESVCRSFVCVCAWACVRRFDFKRAHRQSSPLPRPPPHVLTLLHPHVSSSAFHTQQSAQRFVTRQMAP